MSKFFNFKTLVSFSALAIAGCAALFSVTGIGTLFAGAAVSAMIMASALELGKLVGISFLYRYWSEIPKVLKTYLSIATVILILITSAGIYGYLSSAYAKVAATPLKLSTDIQILNGQVLTIDEEIKRKTIRLDQIISLRSQQENRIDNLISKSSTGNTTTIRNAQNSLRQLDGTVSELQKDINKISAQRDSLKAKSLMTEVDINTNSDIGTFVYISKAIGVSLDTVVKWFILVIVFVFDPLSICLVLAYNFLIKRKEVTEHPEKLTIFGEVEPAPESSTTHEQVVSIEDTGVEVQPPTEQTIEEIKTMSNTEDPFPQYMTKAETEEVLERWWAKRNGVTYLDKSE